VPISASEIEACYVRVGRGLFNALYRMLWDAAGAEDIIHDAMLRLWSRRRHLHAAQIDALAWTTAINLARNRLRWGRLRQWVGVEVLDERRDPDGADARSQTDLHDLRAALGQLEPVDREIVLLAEFGGFTTDELARILRIAPGTVGSRKHRAINRLRELMQAASDD
jgi:RNA polymerase sigma-70 factor (ECF subfamily)